MIGPAALPGPSPAAPSAAGDPVQLRKAAREFEAMAIGELLKPMFDTIDLSKGPFGGGAGEAAWKPILVEHMAKNIAARGGLGLADHVFQSLLRMQEEKSR